MRKERVQLKLSSSCSDVHKGVTEKAYLNAKARAASYFAHLDDLVALPSTLLDMHTRYESWEKTYLKESRKYSIASNDMDSWSFIEKLRAERSLPQYIRKTVRYLFVRDLGKDLSEADTEQEVERVVAAVSKKLKHYDNDGESTFFDDELSAIAKKRGIESTYHWLMLKIAKMRHILEQQNGDLDGMRKLVKIIAGVLMHQLVQNSHSSPAELDKSIRLGYCYGLTYPFIDDLLDSTSALSEQDKSLFTQALRETLQTTVVSPLPNFSHSAGNIQHVYNELKWAFEYIKSTLCAKQSHQFFKQAYVFFEAQAQDRQRSLLDTNSIDTKSLFLPVMLKSAGSRLIVRDLITADKNDDFDHRTFCFGIYNQFNDDIKDIFDDLDEGNLTPYTYFLTHQASQNEDKAETTSPYSYYWAVVSYLINQLYKQHPETAKLLLERSINAHKSLRNKVGDASYKDLRKRLLFTSNKAFDEYIDRLLDLPAQHAWFDKVISQEISLYFEKQNTAQIQFKDTYQSHLSFIDKHLSVSPLKRLPSGQISPILTQLLDAGGKRLRPVIASYLGQSLYGFSPTQCVETIQMLEFMHTASLIIDDLPSQDNADTRRGQPTIHVRYQSQATAELSSVYLMMRAVEVQSNIKSHKVGSVLKSLSYAANTTQLICEGQLQDLANKNNILDVESLENLYWLKTGLAIEAAFVIPALLAGKDDVHLSMLKKLAKHIGIAFQIKDDLLDVEGEQTALGKPSLQDTQSMVYLLGIEGANSRMFMHYNKANEVIKRNLPEVAPFFTSLFNFIIYRSH